MQSADYSFRLRVWRLTFVTSIGLATKTGNEEPAMLNFGTTTALDFQMATHRSIFTRLLKITSKHALKGLICVTLLSVRDINRHSE